MRVIVDIPAKLIQELDAHRKRLKLSRSGLFADAVDDWLQWNEPSDDDTRNVAGRERPPGRVALVADAVPAAMGGRGMPLVLSTEDGGEHKSQTNASL